MYRVQAGARRRRAMVFFCLLFVGVFGVLVIQTATAATQAATLSWYPPLENTDGTTLQNLAGYRIYYGTSASSLKLLITLKNPGLSRYVVEALSRGAHYFAISSINSKGIESARSQIVKKLID